jgi:hypothetical protein
MIHALFVWHQVRWNGGRSIGGAPAIRIYFFYDSFFSTDRLYYAFRRSGIAPMDSWSFWLTPIPQCSSIQPWAEHTCVYRGELFGRNKIHNDRCSMNPMDLYIVYPSSHVAVQQCKHEFAMTGQLCSAPIGWGQRRPHNSTSGHEEEMDYWTSPLSKNIYW